MEVRKLEILCVVAGSVLLPLPDKILNGIIKEHSYKLPRAAFVGRLTLLSGRQSRQFTVKAPMILGHEVIWQKSFIATQIYYVRRTAGSD